MKYCPGCAMPLDDMDAFCRRCGAPAGVPVQPGGMYPPMRHDPYRPRRFFQPSRLLAVVLAFLAGGIGVHKFYLGRVVQGTIYLLLCWTFIPAMIAFIEGILYMCRNDEQFQSDYWRPR